MSQQRELRAHLIFFFLEKKKKEQHPFCEYDLESVYTFIDLKRSSLLFDIFNILLDYFIPWIRVKTKKCCYLHLEVHNCFHYFPLHHANGKTLSLVQFFSKNHFNVSEVFRILSIAQVNTKFGDSYIIQFCCETTSYKTWLPRSALETIANSIRCRNPLYFDYYTTEVYFKVRHFDSYLGKTYACLDVTRV